jgi:hypothetical protein
MVGRLGKRVEQAVRALKPAPADRVLAAELPDVAAEPGGDASRSRRVAALAVAAVRAFARGQRERLVGQPPAGPAESLPRLGEVLSLEDGLEGRAGPRPLARGERLLALGKGVAWFCGDDGVGHAITLRPPRPPANVDSRRFTGVPNGGYRERGPGTSVAARATVRSPAAPRPRRLRLRRSR